MCFLQLRCKNKMSNLIFHKLEIKINQRHRADLSDLRDCKYNCNTNCAQLRPCMGSTLNKILLCFIIQASILTSQMTKQRPRLVKSIARGHVASQGQSKGWDSGPSAPKPGLTSGHSKSALSYSPCYVLCAHTSSHDMNSRKVCQDLLQNAAHCHSKGEKAKVLLMLGLVH